jgi:hypothetical protein
MASIFRYGPYAVVSSSGLAPGAEDTWFFGPWPWYAFVVSVTAHPLHRVGAGTEGHLTVTRVSTQVQPSGDRYVYATVRNIGADATNYAWWLGGVQP